MRARAGLLAVLAVLLPMVSGCLGRAIGEGAEKTLGPKGAYWEEQPVAEPRNNRALAAYTRFQLAEVKNEFGRNLPPDFIGLFQRRFAEELRESGLPNTSSGKTLEIRVSLIHYEKADATDNVLGPLEQVVARVQLVDAESGKVLASGNVIGRTGKSVGLGTDWKAWGLARGIVKWIRAYHPRGAGETKTSE